VGNLALTCGAHPVHFPLANMDGLSRNGAARFGGRNHWPSLGWQDICAAALDLYRAHGSSLLPRPAAKTAALGGTRARRAIMTGPGAGGPSAIFVWSYP